MEISDAAVDSAMSAFTDAINSTGPCARCEGRGYHHGFGEHGHDPDWCEVCGGSGFVPGCDERTAIKRAVEAALSLSDSDETLAIVQAYEMEKKVLYEALERALSHFVTIGSDQARRAAEEIEAILNTKCGCDVTRERRG